MHIILDTVESVIIPMVRRRTRDAKVGVRKAALQALEAIIRLDMTNVNKEVLELYKMHMSHVYCGLHYLLGEGEGGEGRERQKREGRREGEGRSERWGKRDESTCRCTYQSCGPGCTGCP